MIMPEHIRHANVAIVNNAHIVIGKIFATDQGMNNSKNNIIKCIQSTAIQHCTIAESLTKL